MELPLFFRTNILCALLFLASCGPAMPVPDLGALPSLGNKSSSPQDESPMVVDERGGFLLSPVVVHNSASEDGNQVTYSGASN